MRFSFLKLFFLIHSLVLLWTITTPLQAQDPPTKYDCDQLYHIGRGLSHQGRKHEALEQIHQAYACYREVGHREGEAATLIHIGGIYGNLGQCEQALGYYQQGLSYYQEIGDQEGEGSVLLSIAMIFDESEQYEQALDYYQQSLSIFKTIDNPLAQGAILDQIGMIYIELGQCEQALDYYQQGLPIYQVHQSLFAIPLSHIGDVYADLGQYEQALDYYHQSLNIMQAIKDRGVEINLMKIGMMYTHLGQYEQALEYLQQSLSIQQDIDNREGEAEALKYIGAIFENSGRYGQALDYYRQALTINQQAMTISQEIGDWEGEADALFNIAFFYAKLGQYEQAIGYYQQILGIQQVIGDPEGEGRILNNIGAIYDKLEQYEQALDYYQQSLVISQEIGDRTGEGNTLNNIGRVYYKWGQYEQALDHLQQSLTIRQATGERFSEGATLILMGHVYAELGQLEESLGYYQQATDVFEALRTEAGSEIGRSSFIEQYAFLYRRIVDLFYQQDNNDQAFLITERGRARAFLDSLVSGQVRLSDNDAADLLAQERELYAHRAAVTGAWLETEFAIPQDQEREADLEAQRDEADAAYEAIQDKIAARGAELASLVPGRSAEYVLGVPQIPKLLDEQTNLISYYLLEDKVLAFILTPDSFETIPLDITPEDLIAQITAFRDFANLNVAHPDNAITLYQWLIEPLKLYLATPHLTIIPHQQLHYLPFAALTDGEHYLIDDYTIITLPSASALPFIQEKAQQTAYIGPPTPLILGNPVTADYDIVASLATSRDQLGSLPYAEKEAKAIAQLFGVEPLIGEAATESVVRERVSEANILHLAAHGRFNPVAPLNSLIALAPDDNYDGWLTVGEVYGLDLSHTDLVVLSACQTNLGDLSAGDELVGLTRAFFFAGTPTVVASLWSVEDEATALLMERFYTYLRGGMGKAEALRQAQIDVRAEYPSPYYWSGFVLSGDPGEIRGYEPSAQETTMPLPSAEVTTAPVEGKPKAEETPTPAKGGGPCPAGALILALGVGVAFIATGRGARYERHHLSGVADQG